MPLRRLHGLVVLLVGLLVGCSGPDDRRAALEARVDSLKAAIEAKQTDELLEHLHPSFEARQRHDRDWVRRTATLMFLRHRQVGLVALNEDTQLDPTYPDRGHTRAQVALTGTEHWLPDAAALHDARLEWWYEDDRWQLARLDWD